MREAAGRASVSFQITRSIRTARRATRLFSTKTFALDPLRHEDVGLPGTVGVGHDAGDDVAHFLEEEKRMALSAITQAANVTGDVGIEVDIRQRRPARCVVGSESDGDRAAFA